MRLRNKIGDLQREDKILKGEIARFKKSSESATDLSTLGTKMELTFSVYPQTAVKNLFWGAGKSYSEPQFTRSALVTNKKLNPVNLR